MKNFLLFLIGAAVGAAVVYFLCCKEDFADEIVAPKGLISPEEASALDKAFNSRHKLISDSIVKRPDNRSSWYSLTDMRDYLNYAENEAKDLGYTMDGIRVYLGAYPSQDNEVGYTTLFFIPTGAKNSSQGSFFSYQSKGDIIGGSGLNLGGGGDPPQSNYPQ